MSDKAITDLVNIIKDVVSDKNDRTVRLEAIQESLVKNQDKLISTMENVVTSNTELKATVSSVEKHALEKLDTQDRRLSSHSTRIDDIVKRTTALELKNSNDDGKDMTEEKYSKLMWNNWDKAAKLFVKAIIVVAGVSGVAAISGSTGGIKEINPFIKSVK